MDTIKIAEIVIPPTQRRLRPWKVAHITQKMKKQGYNESYPITLRSDRLTLVDGGHRIEAAKQAKIEDIPYLLTDADPITHAIRCNKDGADTEAPDVFDLAELCWQLNDIYTQKEIAAKIGVKSQVRVSQYRSIKEKLHSRAWNTAAENITRNENVVMGEKEDVVIPDITTVIWTERYLREIVSAIPACDNASYRAQLAVVQACLDRVQQKDKRFGNTYKTVTARWIRQVAKKYAWYADLSRIMRDGLVERVPTHDRITLLRAVKAGVYGDKETDKNLEKFKQAVAKLNEQALGIILYCDDALQRIPLLEDKSIALVVTDPPYNVTEHEWDKIGTDEEYLDFLSSWLEKMQPKLCDDYHLFLFCDPFYQARIEQMLIHEGWPLKSRVIWWNRSLPSGRNVRKQFVQTWQMIFHCGTHELNWPHEWGDDRFDVQHFAAPNANTKDGGHHPTPKPTALLKRLIELGSKPTDIVLDPFAGGGPTGAACAEVEQRKCILIEKEDQFCKNIEHWLKIKREAEET